eukprot:TRINITY_DN30233_c0_g1_i1.p1 TRINITY_DN30233_c0_g1~~TRINITY_DN30233_c0_g1_i1.p1  ORF type:complete len:670 (+),score=235.18 TRINITY_DN30233_c0_g1_i1:45-2012(+)
MASWETMDLAGLRQALQARQDRLAALRSEAVRAGERRDAALAAIAAARDAAREDAVKAAEAARRLVEAERAASAAAAPKAAKHVDASDVAAAYAAMEDLDTGEVEAAGTRQARLFEDAVDYPHKGFVYSATDDGGPPQRGPCTSVVPCATPDKGRVLKAARRFAAGEELFYDTSVLDVPNTLASCLIAKKFGAEVEKFMKIARAGKAVTPHNLKTKVLEDGIVLMSRVKKEGKELEQGFDMNPVNVSGCQFRDGVLPVLVEYLENCQNADRKAEVTKVFDLACPIGDADETTAARYLALGTAFLSFIAKPLPEYKRELTTDQAVRLLLTVQCNGIAFRRHGHAGISVFPFASLMQHDCDPNATAHILHKTGDRNESMLKVVALRDIEQGEAISIAYNSTYHAIEDRVSMLRKSHFFKCECEGCLGADRARSMHADGLPDVRYAPPTATATVPELAEELLATLKAMRDDAVPVPNVFLPVGSDAEEWRLPCGSGKRLTVTNAADNLVIRKYTAAEKAAPQVWAGLQEQIIKNDWSGLCDWIGSDDVLHPSHHLVAAVLVQCTHAAFRMDNTRMTLWLMRCLLLNALWVEGAQHHAHVAPAMAEYSEVAGRLLVKLGLTDLAKQFFAAGAEAMTANGLDGTLRHRQILATAAALQCA